MPYAYRKMKEKKNIISILPLTKKIMVELLMKFGKFKALNLNFCKSNFYPGMVGQVEFEN